MLTIAQSMGCSFGVARPGRSALRGVTAESVRALVRALGLFVPDLPDLPDLSHLTHTQFLTHSLHRGFCLRLRP